MKFSSPPTNNNTVSSTVSHFLPTVFLQEWWLTKPIDEVSHKKKLGVAGFTSREQQAIRAFSSAAIRKSWDVFTLETVDGITIVLKGLINKSRTEENGFPAEVFKHFVFGFPPFWENYVNTFLEGGSGEEDVARSIAPFKKLLTDPAGLDGLCKDTPNSKRKANSKSRLKKIDNMDSSQACKENTGLGDFPEGSPNKNKKAVDKLRNANGENMDTSQVGKGSTNSKRKLGSSSRVSDANQCVDSVQECNQNNERKVVKKSRFANCDKDSTRAGKGRKNTKKAQRGGNGPSDVNQNGAFHTEDSKKKSKVRKEANNSKKKTRRKLSYARSHAAEGESNGDSSASPQLPSLKKSRSGRKLLRPLEFWRNQTAVYDMGRELTCIKVLSSSANRSRATKK